MNKLGKQEIIKLAKEKFIIEEDGTIIRKRNKQICLFSISRFVNDIVNKKHCPICGVSPSSTKFTAEHIIPNWILSDLKLHNRRLTLPNGSETKYGSYTIPCCDTCNKLFGKVLEDPISEIFRGGYDQTKKYLKTKSGYRKIFHWLAFTFIKNFLKDNEYPLERNHKLSDGRSIGDEHHEYEELHHIYCLARVPYSKAYVDTPVLGTILIFQADTSINELEQFDYATNSQGRSVMLRYKDICIIASLADCHASLISMTQAGFLSENIGSVSPVQMREIFSHIAYNSMVLNPRPSFYSSFVVKVKKESKDRKAVSKKKSKKAKTPPKRNNVQYAITARIPTSVPRFDHNLELLNFIKHRSISQVIPEDKDTLEKVKSGNASFLYNEDGSFKTDSFRIIAKPEKFGDT